LARKYKCGLHVDACLGSLLLPFAEKAGAKIYNYSFKVEGRYL